MSERTIGRRAALAGLAATGAAAALPWRAARAQAEGVALGLFSVGDPEAPVSMVEYVSLTCPHCATFHDEVYPRIKTDYIDTGKVRLELREVYFDRFGLWAGMLARCGGESRYFGFISLLLERQDEWAGAENVAEIFARYGKQAGLSEERVVACLSDGEGQKALVEQFQDYRDDPALTGTPTILVAGEKVEDWSFENVAAAIEAELGS